MLRFILEALKKHFVSHVVITREIGDSYKVAQHNGITYIEIEGQHDMGQLLELCGVDLDAMVDNVGEHIATKMCNLINGGVEGMITKLHINNANSELIEKLLYEQRDMMLNYITEDFVYPLKIQGGE